MIITSLKNFILGRYRKLFNSVEGDPDPKPQEKNNLLSLPRYTPGVLNMLSAPVRFVDGASCHFIYKEVFKEEIYKFHTDSPNPYIIDAGANIGLSVIYFKQLYPQADVVAFEPDQLVFDALSQNVKAFGFQNVKLEKKALWNEDKELEFYHEGADAGRISHVPDKNKVVKIQATRLTPYLHNRRVDMLKMDIEGAETTVLKDCEESLHNVDRIFVEYHSFEGHEQVLPELLQLLKRTGFRLNISSPGLSSKSPFVKINSYGGMDMQLNIYAFRP
jgi:FkbM family methyltransferase